MSAHDTVIGKDAPMVLYYNIMGGTVFPAHTAADTFSYRYLLHVLSSSDLLSLIFINHYSRIKDCDIGKENRYH